MVVGRERLEECEVWMKRVLDASTNHGSPTQGRAEVSTLCKYDVLQSSPRNRKILC